MIQPVKTIKLSVGDIQVELRPAVAEGCFCGTIKSNLADQYVAGEEDATTIGAVNAIESFILACACEGIDIESPAFIAAIETTLDALVNND